MICDKYLGYPACIYMYFNLIYINSHYTCINKEIKTTFFNNKIGKSLVWQVTCVVYSKYVNITGPKLFKLANKLLILQNFRLEVRITDISSNCLILAPYNIDNMHVTVCLRYIFPLRKSNKYLYTISGTITLTQKY